MGWNHHVGEDGHEYWVKNDLVVDLGKVELDHRTISVDKDFIHSINEPEKTDKVIYTNCPMCRNKHWERIYKFREYEVYRCDKCGYMVAKDDNIEFAG